jgi:hypothetical protein
MGYSRLIFPVEVPSGQVLTANMAGIGMHFHAEANREANIEDTIFYASVDGTEQGDLRTLSVLMRWLAGHSRWVIADRLIRLVSASESPRVQAFWSAVAHWKKSDWRFVRLAKLYQGPRLDLLETGTDFLIQRHGEGEKFKDSPLRVPASVLRDREMDVAPIEATQKHHRALHYRVVMGPCFRADMWAVLDHEPAISASELARRTYGSFATAWQVKKDWQVIHGSEKKRRTAQKRIA